MQQHLETWLARRRESDPDGVLIPRHVERELRGFLECGILACGFARAHCDDCGHDFLVAFSPKGRGLCPSCTTGRMAETAAHLVECVFPQVPVRQWVVTFPRRLRYFLHRDPVLLSRVRRVALRGGELRVQDFVSWVPPSRPFRASSLSMGVIHRCRDWPCRLGFWG